MKEYLQQNIKDIIHRYPPVEHILKAHDIACVECSVGTCRLSDIIEIHNLDPETERDVMAGIASVIFPGQDVEIPVMERKPRSQTARLSPPMEQLIDEHRQIKKLLGSIPALADELGKNRQEALGLIREGLDFISTYADRFHHAKEEDILFSYFDQSAEIFKVMLIDHETARGYVRAMGKAIEEGDDRVLIDNLDAYRELLTEHIRREDEILYPWMDRNLTDRQVGELFSRFAEVDRRFGDETGQKMQFIRRIGERFPDKVPAIQ